MKKIILTLSLCLSIAVAAVAQGDSPANDKLPITGDYALGVSATPFLNYVGRFFSDNSTTPNSAPTFGVQGQGIYGKYFLADDRAIRLKLLLDIYTQSNKQSVQNDEAVSTIPDATTIDTRTLGVTNVDLSVGYEFRRGYGRVQGFWGGELTLGLGRNSTTYEYGNPMTVANPTPTTGFGATNPSSRTLETQGGLNFRGGLSGFVGVEYFIVSHVSLGGELSLGLSASVRGQDEEISQSVVNGEVREATKRERNSSVVANNFGVRTIAGGNIFLLFYF